jgi:hypothetical protein
MAATTQAFVEDLAFLLDALRPPAVVAGRPGIIAASLSVLLLRTTATAAGGDSRGRQGRLP